MPEIRFTKAGRKALQVAAGENLMKALLAADIPVASSCHGDGVCAKCRLKINQGLSSLSAENETEKFLKEKFSLEKDTRISCQTTVHGDIEIDATYW
jgi:2Fe-2S ferredoxin